MLQRLPRYVIALSPSQGDGLMILEVEVDFKALVDLGRDYPWKRPISRAVSTAGGQPFHEKVSLLITSK